MGNLNVYIIAASQVHDDIMNNVIKLLAGKITMIHYPSFNDLKELDQRNKSIQPGVFLGTLGQVRQLCNFRVIPAKELI